MRQQKKKHHCKIEKIAVNILQNQGKGALAEIRLAGFPDRAGRRVGPKRLVICAAIVITGQAESARRPQNKHRRSNPRRDPPGSHAKPRLHGIPKQFRRIKGREVRPEAVVLPLQSRPSGVHDEEGKPQEYSERLHPPIIAPRRLRELRTHQRNVKLRHRVLLTIWLCSAASGVERLARLKSLLGLSPTRSVAPPATHGS